MVRHHVKKKKGSSSNKKQSSEKEELDAQLENLDRFAGSSDEEDDESDDDDDERHQSNDGRPIMEAAAIDMESDDDDGTNNSGESDDGIEEEEMNDVSGGSGEPKEHDRNSTNAESSDESDNDYQDANDESSDDDMPLDNQDSKAAGMSNAMTRILGGASSLLEPKTREGTSSIHRHNTSNYNVVLSKTTTPLQRLQQKIKKEEALLRQKRRERRSENLSAMRLPLAPTAGMSADKLKRIHKKNKNDTSTNHTATTNVAQAMAREIESERTHRRIATRGVVALFNAISKHRAEVAAEQAAREEEKKRLREEGVASRRKRESGDGSSKVETSKHGFLDRIKSSAVAASSSGEQQTKVTEKKGGTGREEKDKAQKKNTVGWSALKDDFMMNSKLKVSFLFFSLQEV